MTAEAWPTEDAGTAAVEAAARAMYEAMAQPHRDSTPEGTAAKLFPAWEDLDPMLKLHNREVVLPVVWAALAALPDPRYAAWSEGLRHGQIHPTAETAYLDNPYPFPAL